MVVDFQGKYILGCTYFIVSPSPLPFGFRIRYRVLVRTDDREEVPILQRRPEKNGNLRPGKLAF